MYTVTADDNFLYHPRMVDSGFVIYNPVLILEANKAGSFQFTLPVTNILYNSLQKMKTVITVYQDGEPIFRGRILNDERDFNNNKSVYCEGELAFLLDGIIEPKTYKMSVKQFFKDILREYNAQVDDFKKFEFDEREIEGHGVTVLPDTEISINLTEYLSAWNVINTYLLDVYGGYLRVNLEAGHRYLDYVSSYGNNATQTIEFGKNMLDMSSYVSADQLFTHLIPLGASYAVDLDTSEITTGQISKIFTEPIANKGGTATNFIFSLEVILNSQDHSDANNKKSNITINYGVKTKDGTSVSWSGLDGNKIYADIQFDPGLTGVNAVNQKSGKASLTVTGTEQTLVTWTGNVATSSIVITGEFINQYTTSTNGAKPAPISNSMASVVQLLQQKYVRTTIEKAQNSGGRNYIVKQEGEDLFGKIVAVHTWDDVTDPDELYSLGTQYLDDNYQLSVKLEVNAVDLNLMDVAYQKFKIGDRVQVNSAPHGIIGEYYTLSKMTLYLQQPENNTYNFGAERKTLTETQITAAKDIEITNEMFAQLNNDLDAIQTLTEQLNELVSQIYNQYSDVKTVINNLDTAYADIDFANIDTAAIQKLAADMITAQYLDAAYARIDLANLTNVSAEVAAIQEATINSLLAREAVVEYLKTEYMDAEFANITQAAIDKLRVGVMEGDQVIVAGLDANYASVDFANITDLSVHNLTAEEAFIEDLTSIFTTAEYAAFQQAVVHKILGDYGLIQNLSISDGYVTGTLNGVRINGDLINAGTLKADTLLLRGLDGLYYQLNVHKHEEGEISESDWTKYNNNGLIDDAFHGTNIIARSITADRIAAGTLTANEIMAGTITANELSTALVKEINDASTGYTTLNAQLGEIRGSVTEINHSLAGAVTSSTTTYAYSPSATERPASDTFIYTSLPPSSSSPSRRYIWRKVVSTTVDGTTDTEYSLVPAGIESIVAQYALSTSKEEVKMELPITGDDTMPSDDLYPMSSVGRVQWFTEMPEVTPGYYLWQREETSWYDGTVTYENLRCLEGISKNAQLIYYKTAQLDVKADQIQALVEDVDLANRKRYSELTLRAGSIESKIVDEVNSAWNTIKQDYSGITNIVGEWDAVKGFYQDASTVLDKNGFHVSTSDTNNKTNITGNGITVTNEINGQDVKLINIDGEKRLIEASNMTVSNYFNIKYGSLLARFEHYSDARYDTEQVGVYLD